MEPTIPTPKHPVRETRAATKRREAREAKESALTQQPVGATKAEIETLDHLMKVVEADAIP